MGRLMYLTRPLVVLTIMLFGALAVQPAMAAQGSSEAAQACKHGGWQNALGADGRSFRNQGKCVSYVVQGGTLADVTIVFGPNEGLYGPLTLSGSGLKPFSELIFDLYISDSEPILNYVLGTADSDGNYQHHFQYSCDVSSVTLYGVAPDGSPVTETAAPPC